MHFPPMPEAMLLQPLFDGKHEDPSRRVCWIYPVYCLRLSPYLKALLECIGPYYRTCHPVFEADIESDLREFSLLLPQLLYPRHTLFQLVYDGPVLLRSHFLNLLLQLWTLDWT